MPGGGDPEENLSGLGGPLPIGTTLIVTGTRMQPKKTSPPGCLGAKLRAVGKKPRA